MLRFLTAGESHGPSLSVIVEGLPAGLAIDVEADRRRTRATPTRLRPRTADALRARRTATHRRRAPRPHPRLPGRHRDPELRVAQVGRRDVGGAGHARARSRPSRGPVTPTSPACRSTASMTRATSWSAPARARPRRASSAGALAKALLSTIGDRDRQPRHSHRRGDDAERPASAAR